MGERPNHCRLSRDAVFVTILLPESFDLAARIAPISFTFGVRSLSSDSLSSHINQQLMYLS